MSVTPEMAGIVVACPSCQKTMQIDPGVFGLAPMPGQAMPSTMAGPVRTEARTSGKAVASLILGIVSFCIGLAGIIAIILGAAAKSEIDEGDGRLTGRGMAIAGIVLGAVGLGLNIIGLILMWGGVIRP